VTAPAESTRRRRFPKLLWLALVPLLLGLATASLRAYRDLDAQRSRAAQLEGDIQAAERRLAALRQRLERLRGDAVTLERLAREELGWVRPGEVVFVFPADLPEAPPAPGGPVIAPPAGASPPLRPTARAAPGL